MRTIIGRQIRKLVVMTLLGVVVTASAHAEVRSPLDEANALQRQLRTVVERSAKSVYAVTAFTNAPPDAELWADALDGPRFAALAERFDRSCGTAFAIDDAGRLLTSEHVIGTSASVWVTDDAGRVWPAVVVGSDPRSDLAVLKIPVETVGLRVGDEPTERGDLVVTLGNPDGRAADGSLCASVGNVSVADRSLAGLSERERRSYAHMIQMTTPISVGSSGGPLLNLNGDAVGVVCAVANGEITGLPIGFATSLASATTRGRIDKLAHGEEVVYGYLGVSVSRDELSAGAHVDHVEPDAPAAGVLREGDVVVRFDGEAVPSDLRFVELAGACRVEADVPVVVKRGASEVSLVVRPRRRTLPATPVTRATQRWTYRGVTFANGQAGGVKVLAIDGESPLTIGATIRRVNGDAVADVAGLMATLHKHAAEPLELE